MANVTYWAGSWASAGPDDDLVPGDTHSWITWPVNGDEAISISAHPVQGGLEHILAVENVQIESASDGRRIFFTVRNAGESDVPAYIIGHAFIS